MQGTILKCPSFRDVQSILLNKTPMPSMFSAFSTLPPQRIPENGTLRLKASIRQVLDLLEVSLNRPV